MTDTFQSMCLKVLNCLKHGTIEGENETAVYKTLSNKLKIDVKDAHRIVTYLQKNNSLRKSSFTSYSPTTRKTTSGYRIYLNRQRTKSRKPLTSMATTSQTVPQPASSLKRRTVSKYVEEKELRYTNMLTAWNKEKIKRNPKLASNTYVSTDKKTITKKRARGYLLSRKEKVKRARKAALLGADRAGSY